MKVAVLCALIGLAGVAQASAPEATVRPLARTGAPVVEDAAALPTRGLRPALRPASAQAVAIAALAPGDPVYAPGSTVRPLLRSPAILQRAMAKKRQLRKGQVCGDIALQGEEVGRVPGKISACGIPDAVRVQSVSGVRLSTGSLMDCTTAKALKTWVDKSVKPTFKRRGPVVEMQVAAHYACRTRNNQKGAKISEHGRGRAIDISAFTMSDGEVITVLNGWRHGNTRDLLRKVHRGACGPFGTVLGPNSDRYHQDHFHFDTAQYRNGPYCR